MRCNVAHHWYPAALQLGLVLKGARGFTRSSSVSHVLPRLLFPPCQQEVVKLARRDLQRGTTPQVRRGCLPPRLPLQIWLEDRGHARRCSRCDNACCSANFLHVAPNPPASHVLHQQEVAERLSALAVKRGSQDNVAVVLIDLGKVDWSKSNGGGNGLFGGLGSIFGSR